MKSLRIPPDQIENIRSFLRNQPGTSARSVSGALWSYTDGRTFFTLYPSGILLLQGKDVSGWVEKILERIPVPDGSVAGCDEAGKGEIFGPLVLCCVVVQPERYRELLRVAPRDTKKMKREDILRKAEELKPLVNARFVNISPRRFNTLFSGYRNVNRLMDEAYTRLVRQVSEEFSPRRIAIDAYSSRNPFEGEGNVLFTSKGEDKYPEISAAAILAKEKYLRSLRRLEETFGVKIPGGSGREAKELARHLLKTRIDIAPDLIKMNFIR